MPSSRGCRSIGRDIEEGKFIFDESLEDIHMVIEAALIERIGEAGKKLHTGRSRNDQVATDLRLWIDARRYMDVGQETAATCARRSSAWRSGSATS